MLLQNRLRAEFNAEGSTPSPFTRLHFGPLAILLGPRWIWPVPLSAFCGALLLFIGPLHYGAPVSARLRGRSAGTPGLRRLRGLHPLRLLRPSVPALRPLRPAPTSAPPFRGPKRAAPRYKTPKGPRQIQRGPNKTARGPKFRLVNGEGLIPLSISLGPPPIL